MLMLANLYTLGAILLSMRYDPGERYRSAGEDKCWEMFHPELGGGPHCAKDLGHEDAHQGNGLSWAEEPQVDAETAKRFLGAYYRIPNSNHEITLNHDGTVAMTLRGLEAAVRFIGLNMHGDD